MRPQIDFELPVVIVCDFYVIGDVGEGYEAPKLEHICVYFVTDFGGKMLLADHDMFCTLLLLLFDQVIPCHLHKC